jgi:hypothetical protein
MATTNAQKFLTFSAVFKSVFGVLTFVLPWDTFILLYPAMASVPESRVFKLFAMTSCLGWGAGKWTAVKGGDATTRLNCRLNTFPMLMATYISFSEGTWDVPVWLLYSSAYVYFGFIEDASKVKPS